MCNTIDKCTGHPDRRWCAGSVSDDNLRYFELSPLRAYPFALKGRPTAALQALATGEAIVFVQEPLGLFGHQDTDLFAFEDE